MFLPALVSPRSTTADLSMFEFCQWWDYCLLFSEFRILTVFQLVVLIVLVSKYLYHTTIKVYNRSELSRTSGEIIIVPYTAEFQTFCHYMEHQRNIYCWPKSISDQLLMQLRTGDMDVLFIMRYGTINIHL